MASFATPVDVSVLVSVASDKGADDKPSFATERRVTPSWTVLQLKAKLETMTGIPPSSQRLRLKSPGHEYQWMDEDDQAIGRWSIGKGCEIEVHDQRPVAARPNYTDVSTTEKFELPDSTYESLPNSVLAWKKAQKLGRFDPNATTPEEIAREQVQKDTNEIKTKGIKISERVIILPSTPPHVRRGTVKFVGPVPAIPSPLSKSHSGEIPKDLAPIWVGVELDEPTGKNDGSVNGERYFTCLKNCGVFVKPEKLDVGDYPPLGLDLDDDMEEI
ncbi:tubulin folding cofactor B [Arthroderma uncinatum]|uniref:tubulin folding cofactor B n=1 Tax=Arthroderma uncinatum TaxID=74035 RepID=UPI00144AAC46|nr:tubulin folding cofactor B [Arthroderma uncinatum]KAF3483566.1 tubulin folding cofactor B [Arthroderma uncinatum]